MTCQHMQLTVLPHTTLDFPIVLEAHEMHTKILMVDEG
jgi:hypothetical protein